MKYLKEEIINRLENETERLMKWYEQSDSQKMISGPEGAWTAGQHLLHMIKSTKSLAVGLGYPRFIIRLKYGITKNGSDSYEELVKRYTDQIDGGGVAPKEYVPREVKSPEKDVLLVRFRREIDTLIKNIRKWPEKSLDQIVIPHPLMGKITVREMLYFTIYHTSYHAMILEERY